MSRPQRTYLIAYHIDNKFGRFFNDRPDDRAPNRSEIEAMELKLQEMHSSTFCVITHVSRIEPEDEARP
jgi:hypothetical protein